jgi:hypothetical protein
MNAMNIYEHIIVTLCFVWAPAAEAQNVITGRVVDKSGLPLIGANVTIVDSYDGATTDAEGFFHIHTELSGKRELLIKYIGFKDVETEIEISSTEEIIITMREEQLTLGEVIITAGSFEAGDKVKSVVLQPLDIALTASGSADIYGTLSTLPGVQMVGEQGRLFVRGGEAYEAKTFINGLSVQNPYTNTANNVPSRGRFSPLLFSGTMFSTGGYSAEYGQALSSALVLTTNDMPVNNMTDINIYSVGLGLSTQRVWNNDFGIMLSYDYSNMEPYYSIVKQNADWNIAPTSHQANLSLFKKRGRSGLIKSLFSFNTDKAALRYPLGDAYSSFIDPADYGKVGMKLSSFGLLNNNSYTFAVNDNNTLQVALGVSYDRRRVGLEEISGLDIGDNFFLGEFKIKDMLQIADKSKLTLGIDYMHNRFDEQVLMNHSSSRFSYVDHFTSAFSEIESYLSNRVTLRAGIRAEYSTIVSSFNVSPRLSLAYSLAPHGQFSFSYGMFFQNPDSDYLKFTHRLKPEKANHFILNYQWEYDKRVFRAEAYYKRYDRLIKYTRYDMNPESYYNGGSGYATGIDIFFRDKKSIPGGDYWVSYSFVDTKRNARDYPIKATPKYFSKHNFSIVYKQWIPIIHSNIGMTYNWMSGRPYYNPNLPEEDYLSQRTKEYSDLSLNYAFDLSNFTKIPATLFCSVTNLLGQNHVYGYYYNHNSDDTYDMHPISAMSKRMYMVAILISIK